MERDAEAGGGLVIRQQDKRRRVTITSHVSTHYDFDEDSSDESEAELGSRWSGRVTNAASLAVSGLREKTVVGCGCRCRKSVLPAFILHVALLTWMWRTILAKDAHLADEIELSPQDTRLGPSAISLAPVGSGVIATLASTVIFFCWGLFEFIRVDSTRGMSDASAMIFFAWLQTMVKLAYLIMEEPEGWCTGYYNTIGTFLQAGLQGLVEFKARAAIQRRIEVVEQAFEQYLGSKKLFWISLVGISRSLGLVGLSLGVFVTMPFRRGGCVEWAKILVPRTAANTQDLDFVSKWFLSWGPIESFCWIATVFIVATAYGRVLKVADGCTTNSSAYVQAELNWAKHVLSRARFASAVLPCCIVFTEMEGLFSLALHKKFMMSLLHTEEYQMTQTAVAVFLEVAAMLWLVGFFRPQRPQVLVHSSSISSDGRPKQPSMAAAGSPSSLRWQHKVMELAHRSMTVGGLLDFYCLLGTLDVMTHYSPLRHTTNDVVRSAVIPLSRTADGGVAYATLGADPTATAMPDRMVTHDWRNTFINLVAAIIADALGTDEYKVFSDELALGHAHRVRRRLQRADVLGRRYWICAFCVNQHSSICGGYGSEPTSDAFEYYRWKENRYDSVTGEPLPVCACTQRKIFNEDDEDLCELNKFDDLMSVLAAKVPDFTQVVAVDRNFGILSRLWCIAEMVQAHVSGIPQQVKLLSMAVLDIDSPDLEVYARLANLRVAECHASRAEDKAWILGKIPDLQDFDARLHGMIFGDHGLLHNKLLGLDILHAAIRTVLRVQAASKRSESDTDDVSTQKCLESDTESSRDGDSDGHFDL